jgi:hypothetical protein
VPGLISLRAAPFPLMAAAELVIAREVDGSGGRRPAREH